MRGKDKLNTATARKLGITPACAGKSAGNAGRDLPCRDHPRVCGEKRLRLVFICGMLGSPPRVRGKAKTGGRNHETRKDHPRVCGEKNHACTSILTPKGSPPRVRGKVCACTLNLEYTRITPACAGKRCLLWQGSSGIVRITPACAGKSSADLADDAFIQQGSPPRVRGKGKGELMQTDRGRITPACAGKRHWQFRAPTAHQGSPPRVRGKVFDCSRAEHRLHEDHPRVCGEKFSTWTFRTAARIGITPACAGKSSV